MCIKRMLMQVLFRISWHLFDVCMFKESALRLHRLDQRVPSNQVIPLFVRPNIHDFHDLVNISLDNRLFLY